MALLAELVYRPGVEPPDQLKLVVWNKGRRIAGKDPAFWLTDNYGQKICWSDYGDKVSAFGWTISHITPVSLGGSHRIWNLRPIHLKSSAAL